MSASMASSRPSAPSLRGLVFAGLLCLASGSRHLASLHLANDKAKMFDYFLLVRQWPGSSYCSKNLCSLLQDREYHFTIHGLWPNYQDGTWPQFCEADDKFDERSLRDLLGDLEAEWPSAIEPDESFWEHEWLKHGTCSLSVFPTEHSYFNNVLELHGRYDLAAALRKSAILPDTHKVYRTKDLADSIHDVYGVRPVVQCDNKELSEIWMCFDKDLRPFNCDEVKLSSTCEELLIPPFRGAKDGTAELDGAAQQQQQPEAGELVAAKESGDGGAGPLAVTNAASDGSARGATATISETADGSNAGPRVGSGSDSSTAIGGPAVGGLNDGESTGGSIAEDSIYWLLQPGTTELLTSASTNDAAAVGAVSSTLPIATPTEVGFETSAAEVAETGVGGSDGVRFSDLYGDAFSIAQPDESSAQNLKQQQQQLELELIEQRLMEQDDQLAADALEGSPDPRDADATGAGALAVLAALAERAISRLHQQLMVGGGGSDLVNDDYQTDAAGEMLLPLPNGGAATAASSGAQDFVWSSKLRGGAGEVAFSADEAEERASLGGDGSATTSSSGGAAAATLAMVNDGEAGQALWSVQRVLVLPAGGVDVGPPMWVVLLLAVQLICLVVVTLCLVVIMGMAIVGVRVVPAGERAVATAKQQQEQESDGEEAVDAECPWQQPLPQQQQGQWWLGRWVGGSQLWSARSGGKGELVDPLLVSYDEDEGEDDDDVMAAAPPKIHLANRDKSAAAEEEEGEEEEEQGLLRQQRQQQREWHLNPLRNDLGSGSVFILPAAAAARGSRVALQPFAPVH